MPLANGLELERDGDASPKTKLSEGSSVGHTVKSQGGLLEVGRRENSNTGLS